MEKEDRGKVEGFCWLALSLVLYMGVMAWIACTLPKFRRLFAEMLAGEPLPRITRLFLAMPFQGYLAAALIVPLIVIAVEIGARPRQIGYALAILVGVGSGALGIIYMLGMILPLTVSMGPLG